LATISEALQRIYEIVERYADDRDLRLGAARQVCNLPWVAEFSYLHRLYPAASLEQIAHVAPLTSRQPHLDFQMLLAAHNGFELFNGSLSIYGVRAHWDRTASDVLWLPYDLGLEGFLVNTMIGKDDMVIGSNGPDVHRLVLRSDATVDRTGREDSDVLESWPSLADMLIGETERLEQYYAADGKMRGNHAVVEGKAPPWPTDPLIRESEPGLFRAIISRMTCMFR
jgi:hypothetical protein